MWHLLRKWLETSKYIIPWHWYEMFVVETLSTAFAFVILQLITKMCLMKELRLKNNSLYDMQCFLLSESVSHCGPNEPPSHNQITHFRYILCCDLPSEWCCEECMNHFVFSTTYYRRLSCDNFILTIGYVTRLHILYAKTWN